MNTKHTPGPWAYSRWDEFGQARFYVAQADGAPYTPDFSDTATLIAETVSIERVRIQEANARLIAAAPELLEVLKMVRDAAIFKRGDDFNLTAEQWSMFHAAIAKATGGAS